MVETEIASARVPVAVKREVERKAEAEGLTLSIALRKLLEAYASGAFTIGVSVGSGVPTVKPKAKAKGKGR